MHLWLCYCPGTPTTGVEENYEHGDHDEESKGPQEIVQEYVDLGAG
jgi:hypothetical protein